jgi:hypothetical protein
MPLTEHRGEPILPSPRKQRTLALLRSTGLRVSDGTDYHLPLSSGPAPTLEAVREALAVIPGSLSEEIVRDRDRD